MAPKRKITAADTDHSFKKARIPSPANDTVSASAASNAYDRQKATPDDVMSDVAPTEAVKETKRQIDWAMPAKADKGKGDYSDSVTRFAPVLFNQHWLQLETSRPGFPSALIRSPLYKKGGYKDKETDPKHPNRYNKAFLRLFNHIKKDTESKNPNPPVRYTRQDFEHALGNATKGVALVASASMANPVLALNGDYRVVVTIQHTDREHQIASAKFIRRPPSGATDDSSTEYAYFIDLPSQTKITINGETYVNDVEMLGETEQLRGDQTLPSPFIIGPLGPYTVIELLSQPIFFFGTKADLDFGRSHYPKAQHLDDSVRDTNGDADEDIIEVVWQPLDASPLPDPTSQPEPEDLGKSIRVEDSNDEHWTDDAGVTIKDPCDYFKRCLWVPQRDHYEELIPRVLASINLRQIPSAGFHFIHNGRIFRPLRTGMIALPHRNHHVLIIVRKNDDGKAVLQILDPMSWASKSKERETLVERANEFARRGSWRTADETNEQDLAFSLLADWTPCAQHVNEAEASTYVILSAWALSMGLQVDPSFTADDHGCEDFFTRAQWLFDLALRDLLDWKILFAFFKCTRFVKVDESTDGDDDHGVPPIDRRFRQSRRTFERAIEAQEAADKEVGPHIQSTPCLTVRTGVGKGHMDLFAADGMSDEMLKSLVPLVRQGRWDLNATVDQLRERLDDSATSGASVLPQTGSVISAPETTADPPAGTEEEGNEPSNVSPPEKTNEAKKIYGLPDDFDPCGYLNETMSKKLASNDQDRAQDQSQIQVHGTNPQQTLLSSEDVYKSIAEVASLINSLHPENEGVAVLGSGSAVVSSSESQWQLSDRFVLLPWSNATHNFLVVAQVPPKTSDNQTPTLHAIDSAPWTLNSEKRKDVRVDIGSRLAGTWCPGKKPTSVPTEMTWVLGPRQNDLWQSKYYAIVNAWAVLLGCTLNFDFQPRPEFFTEAHNLIQVLLAGQADWRLVYAFLNCHKYILKNDVPDKGRWFPQKQPAPSDLVQPSTTLHNGDEDSPVSASFYDFKKLVKHSSTRPHDNRFNPFAFEDWDETDISVRAPALGRHGQNFEKLSALQLREAYRNLVTQPRQSLEDWSFDTKPCGYLRNRLAELLNDEDTAQRLGSLRSKPSTTILKTNPKNGKMQGTWLVGDEIGLAIAAVTLAITKIQDVSGGFCIVPGTDVEWAWRTDAPGGCTPAIAPRFGRPMLIPIVLEPHTVLAVVQYKGKEGVSVSIVDSMARFFGQERRNEVMDMVVETIRKTMWWRQLYNDFGEVPIPKIAEWIPCAQQPSSDECGYSTIVNAWALALGLEINPHAAPIWNASAPGHENLYQRVLDLAHLARLGLVDWRLIYAFLRCYRFVHEGQVPQDRRFTNTVRLDDETALREHLDEVIQEEHLHWTLPGSSLDDIKDRNTIRLPIGFDHTYFVEDSWSECLPAEDQANDLAELGLMHAGMTVEELGTLYKYFCGGKGVRNPVTGRAVGAEQADFFLQTLMRQGKDLKRMETCDLLKRYQDFLYKPRSGSERVAYFQQQKCAIAGEGLGRLEKLLNDAEIKEKLASAIPKNRYGQFLLDWEVNIAIAAVVEAIDSLQAERHRVRTNTPFTGGFALATSLNIAMARGSSEPHMIVSRPRRTWLQVMTINGLEIEDYKRAQAGQSCVEDPRTKYELRNKGHHFLAVIQEQPKEPTKKNPAGSQFHIYTLDSSPHRLSTVPSLVHDIITTTARNLKWTSQRNGKDRVPGRVKFRNALTPFDVLAPLKGGWQCGLHTILNAWILALGLLPRSTTTPPLQPVFYQELWLLIRAAVAGLLDWKTLVAWLFCNNLVTLRNLDGVRADRRFETSVYQSADLDLGETGLVERVARVHESDAAALEDFSETEMPYDYSSNVDFSAILGAAAVDDDEEEEQLTSETPSENLPTTLGLPPHTPESTISSKCTPAQRAAFLAAPADQRSELLYDYELTYLLEGTPPDSAAGSNAATESTDTTRAAGTAEPDHPPSDGLTDADASGVSDDEVPAQCRIVEEPGSPGRGSLKRAWDDGDLEGPRKRGRFLGGGLGRRGDVVRVGWNGSVWRRARRELAFLKAY